MIPKAELHCHLEGSIPPSLARDLATRNGLEVPAGLMGADGGLLKIGWLAEPTNRNRGGCGRCRS